MVYQLRGPFEFLPLPLLLIDDKAGRRVATELGIPVAGAVGILLQAKQNGQIAEVRPLLNLMRTNGYWISEQTVKIALKIASESSS